MLTVVCMGVVHSEFFASLDRLLEKILFGERAEQQSTDSHLIVVKVANKVGDVVKPEEFAFLLGMNGRLCDILNCIPAEYTNLHVDH